MQDLMVSQRLAPAVVDSPAGADLCTWLGTHRSHLRDLLNRQGAVVCRGFRLDSLAAFGNAVTAVGGEPVQYDDPTSPRTELADSGVYTSTDHPAHQSIPLHNEMSYSSSWPRTLGFLCLRPADDGGQTPLADCRRVLARLDPDVVRRFDQQGWVHVRNFHEALGRPWQEVFDTSDPAVVHQRCRERAMTAEWLPEGHLRTIALRPATTAHPATGERSWFNHAVFFHPSSLDAKTRKALSEVYEPEQLPHYTCYGDGTPFEPEVVDHIRASYAAETVRRTWQAGDVLLLDNVLTAHGRDPFHGPRTVLVAMAGTGTAAMVGAA